MDVIHIKGALSDAIMGALTGFNLIDDVSDKIDQCTISFNASRFASLPPFGAEYQISIHGQNRGTWVIIGRSITLDYQMSLKLSTVKKNGKIKAKKTQSYVAVNLGAIVQDVVISSDYKSFVDPALSGKVINAYRNNETAGDFLNRLAAEYDAVSKPYGDTWIFKQRLNTTTTNGSNKPVIVIDNSVTVISATITENSGDTFSGIKVSYWDVDTNERVIVYKGIEPFNDLSATSKAKADDLINSYSSANKSNESKLSLVLPSSEPVIGLAFAETVLTIERGRFFKHTFIIDSVNITDSTTTIQASLPK